MRTSIVMLQLVSALSGLVGAVPKAQSSTTTSCKTSSTSTSTAKISSSTTATPKLSSTTTTTCKTSTATSTTSKTSSPSCKTTTITKTTTSSSKLTTSASKSTSPCPSSPTSTTSSSSTAPKPSTSSTSITTPTTVSSSTASKSASSNSTATTSVSSSLSAPSSSLSSPSSINSIPSSSSVSETPTTTTTTIISSSSTLVSSSPTVTASATTSSALSSSSTVASFCTASTNTACGNYGVRNGFNLGGLYDRGTEYTPSIYDYLISEYVSDDVDNSYLTLDERAGGNNITFSFDSCCNVLVYINTKYPNAPEYFAYSYGELVFLSATYLTEHLSVDVYPLTCISDSDSYILECSANGNEVGFYREEGSNMVLLSQTATGTWLDATLTVLPSL